ncbi:GSCOCG00005308001-RA-CDS, partial [Cotesia congregata]
LNPNKGAGPDGIPNIFLKNCATEICEPLTHIFNKSLQSGTFPSVWKLSYVCPIHKNGQRSEVSNYRPICIQSALAKLFEKLQHGFVGGRSTTSNLYSYTNYLLNALNDGLKVHSIYTDFSKAFDRVNHTILIAKLNSYGVEGTALEWLHSYLADRFLQVRVDGYLSEEYEATSGVPQGSHLGPLLFNIFINDIVNNIQSECLLYTDDLKIYRTISNDSDIQLLQKDIDMLSTWFSDVKDLGILIDNKLTFEKHIDKISLQAFKVLELITRTGRDFLNPYSLLSLYRSLVLPILEYGAVIWSPYTDTLINRVERVQNKFCKSLS